MVDDLANSPPGRRFREHHARHARTEKPWQRLLWIVASLLLVVFGLLLSIPPGVPGFLIWIPALGMLAARAYAVALLLDKCESSLRSLLAAVHTRGAQNEKSQCKPAHALPTPGPIPAHCALFLDVDGTLVDFDDDPADIALPTQTLALLEALNHELDGALALVSGRALADLERVAGHRPLRCVGMHGLQYNALCAINTDVKHDPAAIQDLREACQGFAAERDGVVVEYKGCGVALHYRKAPEHESAARAFAQRWLADSAAASDFEILNGKMLVEFRPCGVDKGHAVERLLSTAPFQTRRPVFIGDDVTDEAGFAAVNCRDGVSIKCGDGDTAAHFRLPDINAVHGWLADYLTLLKKERKRAAES